ncbi:WhiB family transcriptional regulator [Streptomyces sp. RK76]|uniref:WhiB family transcriptional regulator n=1 Tax=Streptomyces sp. RK76 TaxID=2824896 RepID=UPI001B358646|nr:WhiB family transcriptional regulator [Streptomyces sp. RK76]MBQ0947684.1 WhiB family transcriptional regulator [Streptomyces sp. RK76]
MSQYTGSVPDTLRTTDWRDRALCATPAGRAVDFFPTPGDEQGIAKVKAVCAACPVATACLRNAITEEGGSRPEYRHGIRGGLTGDQRFNRHRVLVRARGQVEPALRPRIAMCGTTSGYQKHLREKTEICAPCRKAKNEASCKQKQRQRQKTKASA